ncbi:MAG: 2-dehydro-3-deoxyphosphogluconate aldolase, partial [Verrucomicrobia bacterium]|nr:2-dehydro-3-deoxyphosphogluconate aldolase [Verrucomicrobiota bacterium]
MHAHAEILHRLLNPGVIAVVRVDHPSKALPTAEALLAGGVIAIELTMTIPNALEAIREAAGRLGGDALIGVGTVLDARVASAAIDAGAQFV